MIRKATRADIGEIYRLVGHFANKGDLALLSSIEVWDRLDSSFVCEEDGKIVGYVSLDVIRPDLAEVRSLCVREACQKRGIGSRLLEAAVRLARVMEIKYVLILTKIPRYYLERGFDNMKGDHYALLTDPRSP